MSDYKRMSEREDGAGQDPTFAGGSNAYSTPQTIQTVITPPGIPVDAAQVNTNTKSRRVKRYKVKIALACGILQVILGTSLITISIITLALNIPRWQSPWPEMSIFGGVLFIVTGGLAIGSARTMNLCLVITCMVLSIVSSNVGGLILMNIIDVVEYRAHYVRGYHVKEVTSDISLVLAIVEMIVSIVQSALCCHATCGAPAATAEVRVLYVPYTVAEQGQNKPQQGDLTSVDPAGPASYGNQQQVIVIAPQSS